MTRGEGRRVEERERREGEEKKGVATNDEGKGKADNDRASEKERVSEARERARGWIVAQRREDRKGEKERSGRENEFSLAVR